jgi:glycine/D-amino acid oxidase-like deaminating enzyme
MPRAPASAENWGNPPWTIDFHPAPRPLPRSVDFAVVGAGFTGCAAAAWLAHQAPGKQIALVEAGRIGAGSSGHTGGTALGESAAGDLPGLGDVLAGLQEILRTLGVDADLALPGAWEIAHHLDAPDSPIRWNDDGGLLCVKGEVAGGSLDPGKMLSGLARAAQSRGATICEHSPVTEIIADDPLCLRIGGHELRAQQALVSTNAQSLELSSLVHRAQPKFTLALATAPLEPQQLTRLGLRSRRVFYTVDLPYLWGRLLANDGIIFGGGLVHVRDWPELSSIDVTAGESGELLSKLERRVRRLHPVLRPVPILHRWGGPILFANRWVPVFERHPESDRMIILGAYSGHGVALSVYLGRWAAEVMLGQRQLPNWREVEGE